MSCREGPWAELGSWSAVGNSFLLSAGFVHPDPLWIPFKEVAVTLIYQLAEGPELICAHILQGCAKQALAKLEEKSAPQEAPSKWAGGSMGAGGSSQLLLSPPGQESLPPALPTITPDPLCPHGHIFVTQVGQVTTTILPPQPLAASLICAARETGRSVRTGCRVP